MQKQQLLRFSLHHCKVYREGRWERKQGTGMANGQEGKIWGKVNGERKGVKGTNQVAEMRKGQENICQNEHAFRKQDSDYWH